MDRGACPPSWARTRAHRPGRPMRGRRRAREGRIAIVSWEMPRREVFFQHDGQMSKCQWRGAANPVQKMNLDRTYRLRARSDNATTHLVNHEGADVRQHRHVDEGKDWPGPAASFALDDGQRGGALATQGEEDHHGQRDGDGEDRAVRLAL